MATDFTFNNITNFDGSIFIKELEQNALIDVLVNYAYSDSNNTLNVFFSQSLTTGEETTLNNIVSAHPSADNDLKIIGFAHSEAKNKHHHNIDYTIETATLYPKRSFTFGVLNSVNWYSDTALTNLVLDVSIVYQYDALGLATDRTVTRTWYRENGAAHADIKTTYKDYTINPQDQLDEAIRRRTNNVRQINLWLIGAVPNLTVLDSNISDRTLIDIKDDGVEFFEKYELEKSKYIDVGSLELEDAVKNETGQPWAHADGWFNTDASPLGITGVNDVRDYIIYQLSNGTRNAAGTI